MEKQGSEYYSAGAEGHTHTSYAVDGTVVAGGGKTQSSPACGQLGCSPHRQLVCFLKPPDDDGAPEAETGV